MMPHMWIPLLRTVAPPLYSFPLNSLRLWVGGISCSNCRCAFERSYRIHRRRRHSSACGMRCVHNVGSGCVLSFDDGPWMVYPLTIAHLDVNATCLLLVKSTMDERTRFSHPSLSSFDSRFTNESRTMILIAIKMARLVTIK